jgi:hypothetical protein
LRTSRTLAPTITVFLKIVGTPEYPTTISTILSLPKPGSILPVLASSAIRSFPEVKMLRGGGVGFHRDNQIRGRQVHDAVNDDGRDSPADPSASRRSCRRARSRRERPRLRQFSGICGPGRLRQKARQNGGRAQHDDEHAACHKRSTFISHFGYIIREQDRHTDRRVLSCAALNEEKNDQFGIAT